MGRGMGQRPLIRIRGRACILIFRKLNKRDDGGRYGKEERKDQNRISQRMARQWWLNDGGKRIIKA